jgi:hypothetical protein
VVFPSVWSRAAAAAVATMMIQSQWGPTPLVLRIPVGQCCEWRLQEVEGQETKEDEGRRQAEATEEEKKAGINAVLRQIIHILGTEVHYHINDSLALLVYCLRWLLRRTEIKPNKHLSNYALTRSSIHVRPAATSMSQKPSVMWCSRSTQRRRFHGRGRGGIQIFATAATRAAAAVQDLRFSHPSRCTHLPTTGCICSQQSSEQCWVP